MSYPNNRQYNFRINSDLVEFARILGIDIPKTLRKSIYQAVIKAGGYLPIEEGAKNGSNKNRRKKRRKFK